MKQHQLISLGNLEEIHPRPRQTWCALKIIAPFGRLLSIAYLKEGGFPQISVIQQLMTNNLLRGKNTETNEVTWTIHLEVALKFPTADKAEEFRGALTYLTSFVTNIDDFHQPEILSV